MSERVNVAVADGVATLTLARPDKLNAFDAAMHAALAAAVDRVAGDPGIRAIVLTGSGRAFSSGQDLGERVAMFEAGEKPDLGASLDRFLNPLVRRLRALEQPVVAAVNGIAAGAGCSLALACDIVVAGESASFVQSFIRIGLIPDSGATWLLPRLTGIAKARALAMLGEPIDAREAERIGLIWRVVPDDAVLAEAQDVARKLAAFSPLALALIKRALDHGAGNDLDVQLDLERDLQRVAGASDDYREGVLAFAGKRKPRFAGR